MSAKPLQGVRVLTLEQFGAGPYGTMFLAELGAEVIKVEAPDGDPSRHVGPYKLGTADSEYFQAWNLGKKSVTIDMKSAEGRRQFEALVKTADCVVNNLRGTQPAKLGIDYASLKHLKPSIVCLHISAYGRANERADWPGYDFLMQAEAGLMELTGEPDGPPTRVGVSMIDSMSGLTGIVGLLSLPVARAHDGRGLRRRDLPLRRRHAPAHLSRRLVPQRRRRLAPGAAQRAPVAGAGPDLPDEGRLDLHHVHDPEVLAVAGQGDGPRRAFGRPALCRSQHARREPRRAHRRARSDVPHAHDRRSGWRSSTASCRRRRSIGWTRRSTATLRARRPWFRRCRIR